MEDKIQIILTYADHFDVKVTFNKDDETKKICHATNDFWGGSEDRLSESDDCIYKCVTRLIADEIIKLQMRTSFNCGEESVIKAFNEGIEGFYPIDGTCGIKLDYCDDFELRYLDVEYEIKE